MRNEFLEGVSGISTEAIGCLTDELTRLRQVRNDRLSDLVVEARRAIRDLWDEMHPLRWIVGEMGPDDGAPRVLIFEQAVERGY